METNGTANPIQVAASTTGLELAHPMDTTQLAANNNRKLAASRLPERCCVSHAVG